MRLADLPHRFSHFLQDEDGGATVEWIIVTAIGLTLSIGVVGDVAEGVEDMAERLGQTLKDMDIPVY